MRIVKFYINVIISNMITFNGTLMEGSGLTMFLGKAGLNVLIPNF